jgi:hypothetical protein
MNFNFFFIKWHHVLVNRLFLFHTTFDENVFYMEMYLRKFLHPNTWFILTAPCLSVLRILDPN